MGMITVQQLQNQITDSEALLAHLATLRGMRPILVEPFIVTVNTALVAARTAITRNQPTELSASYKELEGHLKSGQSLGAPPRTFSG